MVVSRAITVRCPPGEAYAFWRDFENLPLFMNHLQYVEDTGGGRSHWIAKGPADCSVEWDADILEDRPGKRISWRTVGDDNEIAHSGTVTFVPAPANRGTEVHVTMIYDPPEGKRGDTLAKLFGEEPGQLIADDLRRFKQLLEVGEVARSEASTQDTGEGTRRPPPGHPGGWDRSIDAQ